MFEVLRKAFPNASDSNIELFGPIISDAMARYEVNTPLRKAHYLAQLGHETAELRYREEIASGAAYEWRRDLGNIQKGDGIKFKGRGHGMLTGRYNYTKYDEFRGDSKKYILRPELVSEEDFTCADTWGWYWATKRLNEYADKDSILTVTRIVNGGYNGLDDRKRLLALAKDALAVTSDPSHNHRVQRLLVAAGYDIGLHGVDGVIGKYTRLAVIAFQRAHDLLPDGIPGKNTLRLLEKYDD